MMRAFLHALTANLPGKIQLAEQHTDLLTRTPLYERYFVCRLPGGGCVYLHHYLRSDPDRGPHDHPWPWAISIPLARGYIEERVNGWTVDGPRVTRHARRPFVPRLLDGHEFHRIILPEGETSWSLFIHGPYTKGWGFLRPVLAPLREIDGVPLPPRGWAYRGVRSFADSDPDWWSTACKGSELERAAP